MLYFYSFILFGRLFDLIRFNSMKTAVVKIKIKPKKTASCENGKMDMIQERQEEERCHEIRNMRCEIETMKATMEEMKRQMNQLHSQLQQCGGCTDSRSGDGRGDGEKSAASASDFGDWVNGLELARQDLETMFESNDVADWASKFILADLKKRSVQPYPISAIKGSRNELLMYDGCAWKKMTDQEFLSSIINKIFKKLLAVFTQWKNENYNRILTSERFSTLYHSNYARILSFNENASKLKTKLFHVLL